MMKRILNLLLCAALTLTLASPALAAAPQTELDRAAAYVREHDIMSGDQNGSLNLSSGLNRAELAVLLTRLNGGVTKAKANADFYTPKCTFVDVPEWARLYVGYCVKNNLLFGYDKLHYGAADSVTPAAACTVILRARSVLGGDGSVWNYNTACSYAASLGWIDESAVQAKAITRGDMAILIYRAFAEPQQVTTPQQSGDGYLINGKPVTEENVLELLHLIEQDWPTDTIWGTHNTPGTHKNEAASTESGRIMRSYGESNTYGCGAYASMVSSLIFGDKTNPGRKLEDISKIRPGDIVFVVSPEGKVGHVVIALESPNHEGRFHRTDGNHGGTIQWPDAETLRSYSLSGFSGISPRHLEVWTRYPESIAYTGNSVEVWP